MAKLTWDAEGSRYYESGISCGVLYTKTAENGGYAAGVAWNGLQTVSESPDGAEPNDLYADNIKYLTLMSPENFKGSIDAYTYPDEFEVCDGTAKVNGLKITGQERKMFGLCYKTNVGNDQGPNKAYILHIVYNCLASPSEKSYETESDSPDAITFSWEFTTTPVKFTISNTEYVSAHLEIDSRDFAAPNKSKLDALEDKLYGKDGTGQDAIEPHLPLPAEVYSTLTA